MTSSSHPLMAIIAASTATCLKRVWRSSRAELTRPRSLSPVSQLRSIINRTYEAFNARDFDAYRDLLDEDVELVMSGIAVRGLAAVTDFVAVTARARPGLRIEAERVFVETGDTLVMEVRMIDRAEAGATDEPASSRQPPAASTAWWARHRRVARLRGPDR